MGGKHTLIVGKSDGTVAMLTLCEKDTIRNIARIQKKMSGCRRGYHRWRTLHAQLQSVYKKMGNRQIDKMHKFSKKLMRQCDKLIFEGMNLNHNHERSWAEEKEPTDATVQMWRGTVSHSAAGYTTQCRVHGD